MRIILRIHLWGRKLTRLTTRKFSVHKLYGPFLIQHDDGCVDSAKIYNSNHREIGVFTVITALCFELIILRIPKYIDWEELEKEWNDDNDLIKERLETKFHVDEIDRVRTNTSNPKRISVYEKTEKKSFWEQKHYD